MLKVKLLSILIFRSGHLTREKEGESKPANPPIILSQKGTIKERRNSKLNCNGLKPSNSIYQAVKTNNQKFLKREKYTTPETRFLLTLELKGSKQRQD